MSSSRLDLPSSSTSIATDGAARPTGASTSSQLLFLAFGLVSFAILWAVPVAFMIWSMGFVLGGIGIAELLERTRGLAPTTYGGAFWLAVTMTVVMVALEIRAMLRKTPERRSWFIRFITRPSTAYFVLFLPTLVLVRIDLRGTDVPDILTTTLLLCCLGYVWFILPLAMAAVSWRLTRWMWRKGSGSGFVAGMLGMLGIAFGSCVPVLCVADDGKPEPDFARIEEAFDRGFDEAARHDAVDGSRALMGALAQVIENEPKALAPAPNVVENERKGFPFFGAKGNADVDTERFGECVNVLYAGHPESLRNKRIAFFVYQHRLEEAVAEEIVDGAVLELCTRHATLGREPLLDIGVVFKRRADSRRKNWYRYQGVRNRCAVTIQAGLQLAADDPWVVESDAVHQALCKLNEIDRRILELSALDHDAREIGEELGLSSLAVRQRKSRALKEVRGLLQLH